MANFQIDDNEFHIRKAQIADAETLSSLAGTTFRSSHGHSADAVTISNYIQEHYAVESIIQELTSDSNSIYIAYWNQQAIAYSKIVWNKRNSKLKEQAICCLERIYVLEEFHGKLLGKKLFQFNIDLAKKKRQQGMWLNVWIENHRAIHFYRKIGFEVFGTYSFSLSPNHANPNYQMALQF